IFSLSLHDALPICFYFKSHACIWLPCIYKEQPFVKSLCWQFSVSRNFKMTLKFIPKFSKCFPAYFFICFCVFTAQALNDFLLSVRMDSVFLCSAHSHIVFQVSYAFIMFCNSFSMFN